MKTRILALVAFVFVTFAVATSVSQTMRTETSFKAEEKAQVVEIQRFQFDMPHLFFKYDYKVNLKGKEFKDVGMLAYTEAIKTERLLIEPYLISYGDLDNKNLEILPDVYAKYSWKKVSVSLELGAGYSKITAPRYFLLSGVYHDMFTLRFGFVSEHGPKSIKEMASSKYAWGAFHPTNLFVALGNEEKTTWMLAGTKGFKDFGCFAFANDNRENNNYWFRAQFGIINANQAFFSQSNYYNGTDYLVIPPFFYTHFSPISTKGLYSFKVDMKKTNDVEKQELIAGRQFGQFGQIAIGYQNQRNLGSGVTLEYFNSVSWKGISASIELKYEHLYKRTTGFLVFGWTR